MTSSLMQEEANNNANMTEPLLPNTSPHGITETEAPQPGYNDEIADM
eukprot:CAMPEP_0196823856 /NCGR_PEP_ID=MMETSP1362-20130617/89369_1 /TAXON_ID=163516 /ORGANISM="Leptocylindrus danicus, Strain CCMP1856" /LENGTH=46 /DNA_ID= /DNA_START= /DNA_END= /DNA_ORIENTATION=